MKPPCKKNYVNCPLRTPTCRKTCKEWSDYQAWCEEQRYERYIKRLLGEVKDEQFNKGNNSLKRFMRKMKDAKNDYS